MPYLSTICLDNQMTYCASSSSSYNLHLAFFLNQKNPPPDSKYELYLKKRVWYGPIIMFYKLFV